MAYLVTLRSLTLQGLNKMEQEYEHDLNRVIDITHYVKASFDEGLARGFCIGIAIGGVLSVMTCIGYILLRGHIL